MMVSGEQTSPAVARSAAAFRRPQSRWAIAALVLGAALLTLVGLAARSWWAGATTAPGPMEMGAVTTGGASAIVIMAVDTGCGPREVRVEAPGPLPITFHNHGQAERTLTIEGVAGAVTAAPGGGEVTGTFALDRPGTYTFWCATAEQGRANLQERWIKGTLIVGDGAAGRP